METILQSTFFNADMLGGIIFLFMGCFIWFFPPRNPKAFYGYHSFLARKNEETWKEANRFAAVFSFKMAAVMVALGTGIGCVFEQQTYWFYLLTVGTVIVAVMLLRGETEWHLSRLFDEEGTRRKRILTPEEYRESLHHISHSD